jgi:hypothetical protein
MVLIAVFEVATYADTAVHCANLGIFGEKWNDPSDWSDWSDWSDTSVAARMQKQACERFICKERRTPIRRGP